jgi:hypothetical protein
MSVLVCGFAPSVLYVTSTDFYSIEIIAVQNSSSSVASLLLLFYRGVNNLKQVGRV